MLALFGEAARESLDGCFGAWLSEDGPQLQSFAHRLKGTAASFGALELRQKAERLEIDAGRETPIERQRLTDIEQTIEATRQAYADWLSRT
nr:Hpt domain-containing protein [Wenzhouxiangella limi]